MQIGDIYLEIRTYRNERDMDINMHMNIDTLIQICKYRLEEWISI